MTDDRADGVAWMEAVFVGLASRLGGDPTQRDIQRQFGGAWFQCEMTKTGSATFIIAFSDSPTSMHQVEPINWRTISPGTAATMLSNAYIAFKAKRNQ